MPYAPGIVEITTMQAMPAQAQEHEMKPSRTGC